MTRLREKTNTGKSTKSLPLPRWQKVQTIYEPTLGELVNTTARAVQFFTEFFALRVGTAMPPYTVVLLCDANGRYRDVYALKGRTFKEINFLSIIEMAAINQTPCIWVCQHHMQQPIRLGITQNNEIANALSTLEMHQPINICDFIHMNHLQYFSFAQNNLFARARIAKVAQVTRNIKKGNHHTYQQKLAS